MSAKSMSSYVDTMYRILDAFQPKRCFEYGSGTSSQVMCLYPSVEYVKSVEHEEYFYEVINRLGMNGLDVMFLENMDEYVGALNESYDLIFIDGRERVRCLDRAKCFSEIIILHDAAREDYRSAIHRYEYQIWTDEGNTVVLTQSQVTYGKLKEVLTDLEVVEPFTEKIIYVGNVAV